ncbi:beta-D-glucosyl crocetin beta-1,6-glucosyltransferase-like [Momordica charantia]|uniref:Glycosyltransferase n=1 Tax=Momordica charantia TaxID=3673 RepID=A0A6J1DQW6_MOMCH|nr:beta-D-glucosyl crocetin beta-1,6-glucosyltransferase-like [Momordica charantia]
MDARQQAEHTTTILMLPWVGYGHLSAYLELAKALSRRNFHIYYCSTPVNIESIKPKLTIPCSSIQFVELHLPFSDDLPPNLHTTNGLPSHLMPALHQAFSAAAPLFEAILQTLCPHLLIYDSLQPWAPQIASSLKIPALNFNTTGVSVIARALHTIHHPDSKFPLSEIVLHNYWKATHATADGANPEKFRRDLEALLCCLHSSCNAILINTFRELEGEYIDYLSLLLNKKVTPIGPLVYEPNQDEEQDEEYRSIKNWLDKKEPYSTIFVSFGSEYFPSNEEMEEIARGLEESGANFIWVVRFHKLENGNGITEEGLLERAGERGMVIQGWAPQARILRHGSIGGFVSHCGWNSVMESIICGVPVIGVPMGLDQPYNAGLVEEAGVGVEAKRDPDGKIQRHEVSKLIKQVVVEKTRDDVRKKVAQMSEILRRKGDEKIDEMVALISLLLKG